jgi:hypothetical protein
MKITDKTINGLIALLLILQAMLFADISKAVELSPAPPEKWIDLTVDGELHKLVNSTLPVKLND